jgi:hypothetical protein
MPLRSPLSAAVAAILAGIAVPVGAVPFQANIDSVENAVFFTSDTASYDAWATDCSNVVDGSGCSMDDPDAPTPNDDTLFFWGGQGEATNSKATLTWTGAGNSPDITSIRVMTLRDDAGLSAPLGPSDGPAGPLTPGGGSSFTFNPDALQGQGIAAAYGRPGVLDQNEPSMVGVFYPPARQWSGTLKAAAVGSATHEFGAELPAPGSLWAQTGTFPNFLLSSVPAQIAERSQVVPFVAGTAPVQLQTGGTVDATFFAGDTSGVPEAYMSDFLVQLNAPADGAPAEAGMILLDGDEPITGVTYSRPSPDDLRASLGRTRADGTPGSTLEGSIWLFNQGGANSSIDGTLYVESTGNATTSVSGAQGNVDLAVGETPVLDGFGFTMPARPASMPYTFNANGTVNTAATGNAQVDSVRVRVGGTTAGSGTFAELTQQTVGPLLGVSPDAGARYFAPGVGQINLDTVDPGDTLAVALTLKNLFGADFGTLDDLTIFNISANITAGTLGTLSLTSGTLSANEELSLTFDIFTTTQAGAQYTVTLSFLTDQASDYGAQNNTPFTFTLSGRTSGTQDVPAPGALALVGLGLAGLAGVRARRRWVAGLVRGGV